MPQKPTYLMTDPRHFGVTYRINPWMDPGAWNADPGAARLAAQESAMALRHAIVAAGGAIETVAGVKGLPDLVFPANAAVVLDGRVLLARFRHPERRGEEKIFQSAFQALQWRGVVAEVLTLPPDVLQEGAGDCIWDADRGFFWAGFGQRSTASSIPAIADAFGRPVVALELASERFYHLDTCFCPLSGGKVLYYPPAFTAKALAAIHAYVRPEDRIEAGAADAAAFSVNAVNIGRKIVMAKPPASLRRKLRGLGYDVIAVDLAPFILSGGGAYCMTLRLDRQSMEAATACAAE